MGIPPDPAASGQPAGRLQRLRHLLLRVLGEGRRRRTVLAAIAAGLLVLTLALASSILARPSAGPATPPETVPPVETTSPAPTPTPTPTPSETPEPPAVALNILLVGSDSRGNFREEEAAAAAGAYADQRADALMLVHVPADRQRLYGFSIPRDLWVGIPGYGWAKVNEALSVGGMPLMLRTVESLFGAPINHTVMMDFEGFRGLTDALGGVEVEIPVPFTSTHDSRHHFPAGINHLNGSTALEFVRERKAFLDGDFQRVRNQQTFLRSVLAKAARDGSLTSRAAARQLAATVLPYLWLDPGFTAQAIESLGFSLRGMDPGNAVFFTLPTAGVGTSTTGQSIVLPNWAVIEGLGAALREHRLGEYVAAYGLERGN